MSRTCMASLQSLHHLHRRESKPAAIAAVVFDHRRSCEWGRGGVFIGLPVRMILGGQSTRIPRKASQSGKMAAPLLKALPQNKRDHSSPHWVASIGKTGAFTASILLRTGQNSKARLFLWPHLLLSTSLSRLWSY